MTVQAPPYILTDFVGTEQEAIDIVRDYEADISSTIQHRQLCFCLGRCL